MVAASLYFTWYLRRTPRSIWEASPGGALADKRDSAGGRATILGALAICARRRRARIGLSSFARNCAADPLLEEPEEMTKKRYCFPAQTQLTGAACCKVQAQFAQAVKRSAAEPRHPLAVGDARCPGVPAAQGVLRAHHRCHRRACWRVWRDRIDQHYRDLVPRLERGVIIGAFAMLFWPAMDYGYQQTADVLFGRMGSGPSSA